MREHPILNLKFIIIFAGMYTLAVGLGYIIILSFVISNYLEGGFVDNAKIYINRIRENRNKENEEIPQY